MVDMLEPLCSDFEVSVAPGVESQSADRGLFAWIFFFGGGPLIKVMQI